MKLALVANCAVCGEPRAVKGSGRCPTCSQPLPADEIRQVRDAVRARRDAFKVGLQRLSQRVTKLAGELSGFATRGVPLSEQDHLDQVIRPALDRLGDPAPKAKQLLESCVWDPQEAGTVAAFGELIREIDAGLAWVASLRDTMPPAEWRAVHRELVRAAMAVVRGQATMAATIVAVDSDDAIQLMAGGENWFGQAARHAGRIATQINLIKNSPADGPIQRDGSIDIAAAAWTSVGRAVTSIPDAADIVRSAFADVPGVSDASDEHAVGLLPILAMSARAVDYELLVARARQLRSVLDAADASASWITDHALLVERVGSGLDRIMDEAERMSREWRHGLPRRHVARTLTEIYRELVEGALCDLGGVLLIAARVSRRGADGVYEETVVEGVKAGDVVNEFVRLGPPCGNGIDMLYRNASAHASVVVTDTGITATQREIRDGRVVSRKTISLTDEEFAEELIALHELLLALQLALLPWMTGHSDACMAAAVAAATPSARQRDQSLALVAGLAGLSDITVAADGDHVTITASAPTATADRFETSVLSVVPAAFGTVPAPTLVTLGLTGRRPVTFTRGELGEMDANDPPHAGATLGLVMARWLMESTGTLSTRDEATFVTAPLVDLHVRCATLAPTNPETALRSLQKVRSRVDEVIADDRRSLLTRAAVHQVDILIDFLDGLAGGATSIGSEDARLRAQRAAASVQEAHSIGEQARAIRDGS
ncbi:hypothetical protein ACFC1R_31675 [Kitasatospora sp. NPDC056138]|uniref:hypothetical protein n=1 Tax=Kitasatospora sp. NPDC056138 TaxID=3345724 RepID=UPI0035D780E0